MVNDKHARVGRGETGPNWDHFWAGRTSDSVAVKENPETWYELVWKNNLESWHQIFERLAPGKRMLEYGCGSAKVSQYMALRGYRCTMLDYSKQALDLAKAGFDALSLEGRYIIGDIQQLGVSSDRFDVVYSGGVLEFFADIQTPIRETVRVLKPGGLFATNIVPNKFSCQTLADIERTGTHVLKSIGRRDFREAFRVVSHLPPGVSKASLQEYIQFCETAGLESVTGRCASPFPVLALGRRGDKLYTQVMKSLLAPWRRFDQSRSRWTEIWGMTYTIYGVKV